MRWLKTFWHVLKLSLTSPVYYKKVIKAPFSFSLKYFVLLVFFTTLLSVLPFVGQLLVSIPSLPNVAQKIEHAVTNLYPTELVIHKENDHIVTNVKEPYFVEFPTEISSLGIQSEIKHFIVIDTNATSNDFVNYSTGILVTGKDIFIQDKDKGVRMYPLKSFLANTADGDVVANSTKYQELVGKLKPYIRLLPQGVFLLAIVMLTVLPLIGTLFSVMGRLIYLTVVTAILWGISKIMKNKISYSHLYQIGMHAITLPIILGTLIGIFSFSIPTVYLFIILLGFEIFILNKSKI